MILNLLVIALVGGMSYAWVTRGFFNALMHMVCVLIAGAVAFAFWEPVSMLIIDKAPSTGFLKFVYFNAWGIGLMFPFAIALVLLRTAMDKIVPANINLTGPADYAGAGICGVISATVATGIIVIGLGSMRVPSKFLGYEPIEYSREGLRRQASLWAPVDKVVGVIYGNMSNGSLYTGDSLNKWYPDLPGSRDTGRMSFKDGRTRNVLKSDEADFKLQSWYKVGDGSGLRQLLVKDSWDDTPQNVVDLNGDPVPPSSYLAGFIVELGPAASEKKGKVSLGSGQVRLVTQNTLTGETIDMYPIAVVSQIDGANKGMARWRYDGKVHIWSAGGATRTKMAFEFAIPNGYEPIGLSIKNTRRIIRQPTPGSEFATTADRDAAIESGDLMGIKGVDLNQLRNEQNADGDTQTEIDGVDVSNSLPDRIVIQKGQQGSLEVSGSTIVDGQASFLPETIKNRFIDGGLRIDKLQVTDDTVIVQIDVSLNSKQSFLGRAAQSVQGVVPPMLVDANGQQYEAVGFYYSDSEICRLRFTPGRTIRGLSELQSSSIQLTRSDPNQKLILIFRPSLGATITEFRLGSTVLRTFDGGGLHLDRAQKSD